MTKLYRIGALAALSFAAISAQALTLHFQTTGTFNDGAVFSATDNTVSLPDGVVTNLTLNSLTYTFTKGPGFFAIPGSYTILNGTGKIDLTTGSIEYSFGPGFGSPISAPAGLDYTSNQSGIVNFFNGTGVFAGLNGKGAISFNTQADTGDKDGTTTTNFDATFEAVPEPASMAVLGIGALGFLAKRRRK